MRQLTMREIDERYPSGRDRNESSSHSHYAEIKARALEMLDSETGFNGHPRDEIWSRKRGRWIRANAIGVAVCRARDEVERRERVYDKPPPGQKQAARLTTSDFRRAEAEIGRIIRASGEA